jgi:hypothetical protein
VAAAERAHFPAVNNSERIPIVLADGSAGIVKKHKFVAESKLNISSRGVECE